MHFHHRAYSDLSPRDRVLHIARHVVFGILIAAAVLMLFGAVVQLLWNAVMPPLTGVGRLDFSHAVGLLILARILVGGFHPGGLRHHRLFDRLESLRKYEDWWREVDPKSFQKYASAHPADEGGNEGA